MLRALLEQNNVATTALLTNFWKDQAKNKYNWPQLAITQGSRESDLFKDPFLKFFYDELSQLEAENRLDKRMWLPLATRSRYFRKTISHAVKNQDIQQIVILGSGFDTLAVRKAKYSQSHRVRFFEIDKSEILTCKEKIYQKNELNPNAIYIGLDYVKENFIERLKAQLDLTIPTLILWEGNTFYLEKQDVINTIEKISNTFEKLILTFDFMQHDMQREKTTLDSFANRKSSFKSFFSTDEMIEICTQFGLTCQNHSTGAGLAKLFAVDETPFHTAEPYSLVSFTKNIEPNFQLKK